MNTGGSEGSLSALEQARTCLLAPSLTNLEQASTFLQQLDEQLRTQRLCISAAESGRLARQLADLRKLAEQAAGFYLGLAGLLKSLPAFYASTGAPELPPGHHLSVEG